MECIYCSKSSTLKHIPFAWWVLNGNWFVIRKCDQGHVQSFQGYSNFLHGVQFIFKWYIYLKTSHNGNDLQPNLTPTNSPT